VLNHSLGDTIYRGNKRLKNILPTKISGLTAFTPRIGTVEL